MTRFVARAVGLLGLILVLTACAPDARPLSGASPGVAITPDPAQAKKDAGDLYARGCASGYRGTVVHPCVFADSATDGSPLVVAVGDSKTAQWVPTLQALAARHHWKLITMTKSGCAFSDIHRVRVGKEYRTCISWNASALQRVLALRPALVVTTELDHYPTMVNGKPLKGAANRAEMVRGLSTRINRVKAAGIPVVTVAETPRMGFDAAACVQAHPGRPDVCSRPREQVLGGAGVVSAAAERSGVPVIDLTSHFCSATTCPAVLGSLLVYRDDHHITATFARSLAPSFEAGLQRGLTPALAQELLTYS
ncbi:SGNH hydrolase domain-containing protein [Kineosporia sp. NBRC 101731]|uniref:SGNH hydrolase domain-containing protein n=1 Tax=Kineosporia sp. NBRC 101731 TaxID=3032199 RepID=UPI0024A1B14F|nr:SGNH hydrolase domain-containing protein [Kineosporia sp. NBRC 101731]GLY33340.1 hypothetical protein Kisp02_67050 [Kineosporia sp. NBRC 101731]